MVRTLVFSRPGQNEPRREALIDTWGRSPEVLSSLAHRTDALLLRLSLVVGKEVFYAALWGSVLASPSVRLPASLFVVTHISRDSPGKEQKYMLGTDYQLTVGAALLTGAWGLLGHTGTGRHRGVGAGRAHGHWSSLGGKGPSGNRGKWSQSV